MTHNKVFYKYVYKDNQACYILCMDIWHEPFKV